VNQLLIPVFASIIILSVGILQDTHADIDNITLIDFTLQTTPRDIFYVSISQDGVTITSPIQLQTVSRNGLGTVNDHGFLTTGQTLTFTFDEPQIHVAYLVQANDFDRDGQSNEQILEVFDSNDVLLSSQRLSVDYTQGHRLGIVSVSDFSNGESILKFTITADEDRFRIQKIAFGNDPDFGLEEFCGKPESDYNVILGTPGDDYLVGTKNNDLIMGFSGSDVIIGQKGNDCLVGGGENDFILGGKGNDIIYGESGDDVILGDKGDDVIYGGKVFFSTNSWAEIFISPFLVDNNGDGINTILGGDGNDSIFGSDSDESLFGGKGNDIIFGNHGHDSIFGDKGNDVLTGGGDVDTIHGGDGNDSIDGGEETDICFDKNKNTQFSNCEITN